MEIRFLADIINMSNINTNNTFSLGFRNGACCPTAIAGGSMQVPCHEIQSLQLTSRSGTSRLNLREPDLHMICIVISAMAAKVTSPILTYSVHALVYFIAN